MPDILTFALAAPMASFGGVAVGERRTGGDHPARSAILGLLAACLGIRRADQATLTALADDHGVAVRALGREAPLLTDYHTAQSAPSAARGARPRTRREELAQPGLGTILTRRDYRTDAAFHVALWRRGASPAGLAAIATALDAPGFVPSLGRKSCPLGLPMAPRIVGVDTVFAAFAARDREAREPERRLFGRARTGWVFADEPGAGDPPLGPDPARFAREACRDEPVDRGRWQFTLRTEIRAAWVPAEAGSAA